MVAAAGAILTGVAFTFEQVLVGRLLIGTGMAKVYIPTMKILATWYRRDEFASLSGILLAMGNLGALSAAGPLALASGVLGWQQVFILLGIVTVVLAAMAWILIRDSPSEMNLPSIQEIEAVEAGKQKDGQEDGQKDGRVPKAGTGKRISMAGALRMTFGEGMRFWPLAIWFFFMYGSIMVYQGLWAGPFFQDTLGWDKARSGMVLTFVGIGMILGCPAAGYVSDKVLLSCKKVLVIGSVAFTIIWAAIWATAGVITGVEAYMAINFLFGFFGGFFAVSFAQVKELFPLSIVGTSTAALNIFPFAGGAILQQVSGLMLTSRSLEAYRSLWLFMLVCMVIATVAVLLSREKAYGKD